MREFAVGALSIYLVIVANERSMAACPQGGHEPFVEVDDASNLGLQVAADLKVTRWADETTTGDLQSLAFGPDGVLLVCWA